MLDFLYFNRTSTTYRYMTHKNIYKVLNLLLFFCPESPLSKHHHSAKSCRKDRSFCGLRQRVKVAATVSLAGTSWKHSWVGWLLKGEGDQPMFFFENWSVFFCLENVVRNLVCFLLILEGKHQNRKKNFKLLAEVLRENWKVFLSRFLSVDIRQHRTSRPSSESQFPTCVQQLLRLGQWRDQCAPTDPPSGSALRSGLNRGQKCKSIPVQESNSQ